MNQHLKTIQDLLQQNKDLSDADKEALIKSLNDADKQWGITEFKLDKTEKVKKATAILLEETIEELEQKRKAVEAQNRELEIETSLEKVRSIALSMKEPADMLDVCKTISFQLQSLGVMEIRNVQTAIFYESKGAYMNYEFYAKHDKKIITETSYTNHKIHKAFADQMLKGKGEWYSTHIDRSGLKDWITYQKTTNVFIDTFLETAASLNYYWFSLGPVALGISTYVPLDDKELGLFKRFLNVFELAYRRYLDIEKAIAQAKEAKIEASLERIRSAAMSMHKSEELIVVCESMYNELVALGFSSIRNAQISIKDVIKQSYFVTEYSDYIQLAMPEAPYDGSPIIKEIYDEMQRSKEAFYQREFTGKIFEDWRAWRMDMNAKTDSRLAGAKSVWFYLYSIGHGYLGISTFNKITDEQVEILKRFKNVFELSYQRFMDVANAEAQAREAQIQLALERVRARTMAMQHSNELGEVSHLINLQLQQLNFKNFVAGFLMNYRDSNDFNICRTDTSGQVLEKTIVPYFDNPVFNTFIEAKEKGLDFYCVSLTFEEKNKWVDHNLKYFQEAPIKVKDFLYNSPGFVISCALTKNVGLFIENFDGIPFSEEENGVLIRFGKVFDQTYTRFLDLQKAEDQAREAQIEAALEKVRSRSLAMHGSDELQQVVNVVFGKLMDLGIMIDSASIIVLSDIKEMMEYWVAVPGEEYSSHFRIPYFDDTVVSRDFITARTNGTNFSKCYTDKDKNEQWSYLFEHSDLKHIPDDRKKFLMGTTAYTVSVAFTKNTALQLLRYREDLFSERDNEVFQRFANVFEQAYIRFLDLKKSEAQAREAKIEAGLERVRSRAMAMQTSEELNALSGTVFTELTKLDLALTRCVIMIYDPATNDSRWWMANSEAPDQPMNFLVQYHEKPPYLAFIKAWQERAVKWIYTLEGKIKKDWDDVLFTETGLSQLPGFVIEGMKAPERIYLNSSFFNFGNISLPSLEPLSEEHFDILLRFAKVFDLTYTRFNDLKQAEAQAKEAKIETSLERIRAKAMAMHHSDELDEVLEVLFDQFDVLGISPVSTHMTLIDLATNTFTFRETGKGGRRSFGEQVVAIDSMDIWQQQAEKWRTSEPLSINRIHFPKESLPMVWQIFHESFAAMPDDAKIVPEDYPDGIYHTAGNCKFGYIGMNQTRKATEEEEQIVLKFATEFGRFYQRFLDLKKAEAQAQEARIETALERIRARALAMHNSNEFLEVANVLREQMGLLGQPELESCMVHLYNGDAATFSSWYAFSPPDVSSAKIITGFASVTKDSSEWAREVVAKYKSAETEYTIVSSGKKLQEWYKVVESLAPETVEYDVAGELIIPPVLFYHFSKFSGGALLMISNHEPSAESCELKKRAAVVFDLAYTRFVDLQKAEAQAREARIETALERVRSKTMAMHNSADVGETVATMFDELTKLGVETIRCGIGIMHNTQHMELWTAKPDEKGKVDMVIGWIDMNLHPLLQGAYAGWINKKETYSYELKDDDLVNYFTAINNFAGYPVKYDIATLPRQIFHNEFHFAEGTLFAFSLQQLPEENRKIFKRFAGVFGQTYRRYLDLQRAEANAREATIEAALEKVRGKAMAMHNSNDLSATASMVFTELRKLGVSPIRCGVGLLNKESRRAQLYSATSSQDGDSLALIGWVQLSHHPVLTEIYDSWIKNEEYYPELEGEQMRSYYELLLQGLPVNVPDTSNSSKQYGHFIPFSIGCLYAWSENVYNETETKILKRFASIIDLTFRRYIELQKTEASAKDAIRQASLDRIRADIASMRTINDLQRITPLIWDELSILGIPFIRCGVFIMDESQELIHTFLSTPDGKAIGAFHLPYSTPGNIQLVLNSWRQKKIYIDHWNEDSFIEFADILMRQGALNSPDQYLISIPHGGFHLHFLPFLQGMLYVGNTVQLREDEIKLIQSVADAFSTAYARYEDFNKLEAAKEQIENTLTNLKQAQAQLVQSEKMASLGELTAGIAHEIQNPLNFVNNFSEVSNELLDELMEEVTKGNYEEVKAILDDVKQNLEKINHHGKRADGIVKGMLQHSRSSSGQMEPTDINVLADEYLRLAYHGLRAKDKSFNATLKTDFDENIDAINVIPQDIGRVILNLITNAFYVVDEKKKQQPTGYEPVVSVATKKINGKVEIKVSDNGNGIPKKLLDKIFQPFFTTKPTGQGTGLGLSLSYDIVKAHGGELKVNTIEGKGTEFIISLPIV